MLVLLRYNRSTYPSAFLFLVLTVFCDGIAQTFHRSIKMVILTSPPPISGSGRALHWLQFVVSCRAESSTNRTS
ncbi:hypothetical protein B0H16DRAFT_1580622 [Mycena metata]|uniref:Uncharacterized protein n=1 Tax=Mycena metata TaxID=1033252 RepID=A0AAD7MVM9_9AGAR|nr:hypothetical protein B0H16DRAFT_1580622 [Mycena metata]